MTTVQEVQTIAEQERQRLARQMGYIQTKAAMDAAIAGRATERQAREVAGRIQQQGQAARTQAEQETATRKAGIRKQTGAAEKQAQAVIGRAREARAREARKQVLPFTKPRALGISSYIANVEAARQQAHRTGRDATDAVTRVRDDYFRQVDQAEATAIATISSQKAGIVRDIRQQLSSYSADMTRQLANLNSGVAAWEADATVAINKAQVDYEAAIRAQLDRPGTEVFADMQGQGLVPGNAIYRDYDKTTGQLDYTIPDARTGQEIFADLQGQDKIPPNAKYESYDSETGNISYQLETPNFGINVFKRMQNAGAIPKDATFVKYDSKDKTVTFFVAGSGASTIPETTGLSPSPDNSVTTSTVTNTTGSGRNSTNVVSGASGIALAGAGVMTLTQVGAGVAAIPTPPTWFIGGVILATALIVGILERERIAAAIKRLTGKDEQASGGVVTNDAGSMAFSIHQIATTPQDKGRSVIMDPYTKPLPSDIKDPLTNIPPLETKLILESKPFQLKGFPTTGEPPLVLFRDPFDVPELRQKGSNVFWAVGAVDIAANKVGSIATRELGISRTELNRMFEQINDHLRQGRIAEGQRILGDMAKAKTGEVTISKSLSLAYEDYLRKKAILDAARKSYVASLNPQPIQGKGSIDAKAAATGVWLIQDILQDSIQKALDRGEGLKAAMADARVKVNQVAKELGLTQQQVDAANVTVVYQAALSAMTQQAIQTATQVRTQGLTDTALQTRIFNATKTAAQTVTQTAVQTQTLTRTQARDMTRELTREATQVARLTRVLKLKKKLPDTKASRAGEEEYPDGTIVWRMGSLRGRNGEYKIIPPPYAMKKPITSRTPPRGMVKTKGTPQQTLTFLGGKVPFSNVSFDLGVTDGFIDVKSRVIKFSGHGQQTDVGQRIPGPTTGVTLAGNTPLLEQLANRPHIRQEAGIQTSKQPLGVANQAGPGGSPLTSGVYSDRKGERLARKHHRGWKRVY